MGEKLYKPILKDGDHLVKSKKNEFRVRGVSQDANNNTTDIVEWEEVEVEDRTYNNEDEYYELQHVDLTPEQQQIAEMIGAAIAVGIIYGAEKLNKHVIQPWWHNSAKPWINSKMSDVKRIFLGKTKATEIMEKRKKISSHTSTLIDAETNAQIDVMMDQVFDSIQFDMSTEEAKKHIMNLIYHMLGVAYEIKMLSNSRIAEQFEDESMRLENQAKAEKLFAEKVADNINDLLSAEKLQLDVSTSKKLFSLLGGGIKINEEYIPVEPEKIGLAINSIKKTNEFEGC